MTGNTGGFGVDAPTVGDIADDAVADGDGARVVVVVATSGVEDDVDAPTDGEIADDGDGGSSTLDPVATEDNVDTADIPIVGP